LAILVEVASVRHHARIEDRIKLAVFGTLHKAPVPLAVADLVQNEWKLLHCGDDDLLARLDEAAQIAGTISLADGCANWPMVSPIWRSSTRRSVTTTMKSKTAKPSFSKAINWCANQAMELLLPLPAEC